MRQSIQPPRSLKIHIIAAAMSYIIISPPGLQAAQWLCNGEPTTHENPPVKFWTSTFLAGNPDWIGGFQIGLEAWNRNPSAFSFEPFVHIGTDDDPFGFEQPPVNIDNGRTEMWATTEEDIFPTNMEGLSAAAIAFPQLDGCSIGEVDILFNANLDYIVADDWTDFAAYDPETSIGPGSPPLSIQEVATHELGHAAGFNEECDLYSVMGDDNFHLQTNNTTAKVYAGTDVHELLVSAYGPREVAIPSLLEDLSVVHFLRVGCDGVYSQHDFTIPTKAGTEDPIAFEGLLSWDDSSETTPFPAIVSRGQQIRMFFTYENLGVSFHEDVPVGFYISENQHITETDRQFDEAIVNLAPGTPATVGTDVTLPSDLDEGPIWLGVIIDNGNSIDERFEDNNATFFPLNVVGFDDNPDFDGQGVPPKGLEDPLYTYQYAAKVVCGRESNGNHSQLTPGHYATTVNVFNGSGVQIALRKRLALSSPPDIEAQGETFPIAEHFLDPDHALAVDCADLMREVFPETGPPDIYEGFVIIDVTDLAAVTAVYSSAGLTENGGNSIGPHSSIDVETIFARSLIRPHPDLIIDNVDNRLDCGTAINCIYATNFTVKNIGDVDATGFEVGIFIPGETPLSNLSVNEGLAAGESISLSESVPVSQSPSLPSSICLGADQPADTILETNEDNNRVCFEIGGNTKFELTAGS